MKRSGDDLRSLAGLLDADIAHLDLLVQENDRAWKRIEAGSNDSLDWAALGYTIHNMYSFIENYLLRIAKQFENSLDSSTWHAELVERMSAEVPGVRPAFFHGEEVDLFHELRAFRHVFRNVYRTRLKPEKVREVQRLVPDAVSIFHRAHERFRATLLTLAGRLD